LYLRGRKYGEAGEDYKIWSLYSSRNIIRTIKSRTTRCAAHIACMREIKNAYTFFA